MNPRIHQQPPFVNWWGRGFSTAHSGAWSHSSCQAVSNCPKYPWTTGEFSAEARVGEERRFLSAKRLQSKYPTVAVHVGPHDEDSCRNFILTPAPNRRPPYLYG